MLTIPYLKYNVVLEDEIIDLGSIEIQDDEVNVNFKENLKLKVNGFFEFENLRDKGEIYIENIEIEEVSILDSNEEEIDLDNDIKIELANNLLESIGNVYINENNIPELYIDCITNLPEELKNNKEKLKKLIEE